MNRGTLISGIGHLVLVVGFVIGDWLDNWMDFNTPPPEVANVMIVSEAEYAGLVLPQLQAPAVPDIPDAFTVQSDDLPASAPRPSDALAVVEMPPPIVPAQLDSSQEEIEAPEISDGAPPDLDEDLAVDLAVPDPVPLVSQDPLPSDEAPTPHEAPRIAPTPVIESPPSPEFSETAVPRVSPESESLDAVLNLPVTAPEEATTEIVTEAETPAPATSSIPRARPEPGVDRETTQVTAPDPEPPSPSVPQSEQEQALEQTSVDRSTAVEQAVEAALAEGGQDTVPTPISASGLSSGEIDALKAAVRRCWNVGATSTEALGVVVTVGISMTRDGKPESLRLLGFSGGSEAAASIAYAAARRAILRCGIEGYDLPIDRYEHWRETEITFNPEKMRLK